jgi:hypothetical protein
MQSDPGLGGPRCHVRQRCITLLQEAGSRREVIEQVAKLVAGSIVADLNAGTELSNDDLFNYTNEGFVADRPEVLQHLLINAVTTECNTLLRTPAQQANMATYWKTRQARAAAQAIAAIYAGVHGEFRWALAVAHNHFVRPMTQSNLLTDVDAGLIPGGYSSTSLDRRESAMADSVRAEEPSFPEGVDILTTGDNISVKYKPKSTRIGTHREVGIVNNGTAHCLCANGPMVTANYDLAPAHFKPWSEVPLDAYKVQKVARDYDVAHTPGGAVLCETQYIENERDNFAALVGEHFVHIGCGVTEAGAYHDPVVVAARDNPELEPDPTGKAGTAARGARARAAGLKKVCPQCGFEWDVNRRTCSWAAGGCAYALPTLGAVQSAAALAAGPLVGSFAKPAARRFVQGGPKTTEDGQGSAGAVAVPGVPPAAVSSPPTAPSPVTKRVVKMIMPLILCNPNTAVNIAHITDEYMKWLAVTGYVDSEKARREWLIMVRDQGATDIHTFNGRILVLMGAGHLEQCLIKVVCKLAYIFAGEYLVRAPCFVLCASCWTPFHTSFRSSLIVASRRRTCRRR